MFQRKKYPFFDPMICCLRLCRGNFLEVTGAIGNRQSWGSALLWLWLLPESQYRNQGFLSNNQKHKEHLLDEHPKNKSLLRTLQQMGKIIWNFLTIYSSVKEYLKLRCRIINNGTKRNSILMEISYETRKNRESLKYIEATLLVNLPGNMIEINGPAEL